MKEVENQNLWKFELGSQESMNVPIWIIMRFQQRNRQNPQNLNNDTSYRFHFTPCQCRNGTQKYPDNSFLLNYDDDDYSQGCGQTKKLVEL